MKKIANYLIALAVAAFTFTSCEDVPSPFGTVVQPDSGEEVVIEPTGNGTEADPYNVAAVLEYISGLGVGVQSDKEFYVKGIISEVKEVQTTGTYGNATYWISDDADGKANKFYIYRGYGLGGKKFTEGATPVQAGDNVVIKSKVMNYNGTYETVQNNCIIVELNGTKDSGGGGDTPTSDLGTKDAPITVAKALETINKLADGGETGEAYVKGTISKVQSYNSQYKSITYYISDDGKETNELQVYSGKGLNGADFAAKEDLAAGDVVVIKGKLKKYVKDGTVTPEINQSSEIISLTKGSGGGGGGEGEAKGTGTANDPFNIAAAIAKCKEIGNTVSTEKYYVKGIVVKGGTASGGYGNLTFDMGDTSSATDLFKAYQVAGSDGEALPDGYKVNQGDEVVVYGPIYNYNDKTPETAGKSAAYIVTINGKKTNDGGGSAEDKGTEKNPFNIAEAIAKGKEIGNTVSTEKYYVKGTVVKGGTASGGYGNLTFDMGDTSDATDLFKAYQVAGSDGEALPDGYKVNQGDVVVVYGPIYNYNNKTPETAGKSAAHIVTINGKKTNAGGGGGGGDTPSGDAGSESNPYSVSAAIAKAEQTGVYVKAYIVGWVDGQVLSEGAKFNSDATVKTNILIAESASVTDVTKCMPVQLPSGNVRTGVNLQDNSGNYKKEVLLYGDIAKYFGTPGLKNTSYAKIGSTEIGTKPSK